MMSYSQSKSPDNSGIYASMSVTAPSTALVSKPSQSSLTSSSTNSLQHSASNALLSDQSASSNPVYSTIDWNTIYNDQHHWENRHKSQQDQFNANTTSNSIDNDELSRLQQILIEETGKFRRDRLNLLRENTSQQENEVYSLQSSVARVSNELSAAQAEQHTKQEQRRQKEVEGAEGRVTVLVNCNNTVPPKYSTNHSEMRSAALPPPRKHKTYEEMYMGSSSTNEDPHLSHVLEALPLAITTKNPSPTNNNSSSTSNLNRTGILGVSSPSMGTLNLDDSAPRVFTLNVQSDPRDVVQSSGMPLYNPHIPSTQHNTYIPPIIAQQTRAAQLKTMQARQMQILLNEAVVLPTPSVLPIDDTRNEAGGTTEVDQHRRSFARLSLKPSDADLSKSSSSGDSGVSNTSTTTSTNNSNNNNNNNNNNNSNTSMKSPPTLPAKSSATSVVSSDSNAGNIGLQLRQPPQSLSSPHGYAVRPGQNRHSRHIHSHVYLHYNNVNAAVAPEPTFNPIINNNNQSGNYYPYMPHAFTKTNDVLSTLKIPVLDPKEKGRRSEAERRKIETEAHVRLAQSLLNNNPFEMLRELKANEDAMKSANSNPSGSGDGRDVSRNRRVSTQGAHHYYDPTRASAHHSTLNPEALYRQARRTIKTETNNVVDIKDEESDDETGFFKS